MLCGIVSSGMIIIHSHFITHTAESAEHNAFGIARQVRQAVSLPDCVEGHILPTQGERSSFVMNRPTSLEPSVGSAGTGEAVSAGETDNVIRKADRRAGSFFIR